MQHGRSVVTEGPFDMGAEARALGDAAGGAAGAVVTFTGVVRSRGADPDGTGGPLLRSLRVEAYPEMAATTLERIRCAAITRFHLTGCTIAHRVGTLAPGEDIVLVAAAAAHRQEAFEAAAWAMDRVKHEVPLWKAEQASDGQTRWVPETACGCAGHGHAERTKEKGTDERKMVETGNRIGA